MSGDHVQVSELTGISNYQGLKLPEYTARR